MHTSQLPILALTNTTCSKRMKSRVAVKGAEHHVLNGLHWDLRVMDKKIWLVI